MIKRPWKYHLAARKAWNDYHLDNPVIKNDGFDIHHKDGNYKNNVKRNLQKLTRSAHMRLHGTGRKLNKKIRDKISKANTGKIFSKEHRRKLSESRKGLQNALGYKHTEKTKRYMSKIRKGIKFTEEHKQKISLALKGKNLGRIPWNKGLKIVDGTL